MNTNSNINNNSMTEQETILSSTVLESMNKSEICNNLYRAYTVETKDNPVLSFQDYANRCYLIYRK